MISRMRSLLLPPLAALVLTSCMPPAWLFKATITIGNIMVQSALGAALERFFDQFFIDGDAANIVPDPDNPLQGRPQGPMVVEIGREVGERGVTRPVLLRIPAAMLVMVRPSTSSNQWRLSTESDRLASELIATAGVQFALRERGYPPGKIDGVWGPRTSRALRDFQRASGLQPSGTLDPTTESYLLGR